MAKLSPQRVVSDMGSLDVFRPIVRLLPEVGKPPRAPPLNQKLMWTGIVLLLFFIMYHVYPIGSTRVVGQQYELMQIIFASKVGTVITAGIGPIVLASIFLQLFAGAKIIDVDLSNPKERALFQGVQKLLAIFLCFFEGGVYVMTGAVPVVGAVEGTAILGNVMFTKLIVILQLAFGSILLLYMDEVVSKYGIGSGISLFIAAGVSLGIVQGTFGKLVPDAITAINEGGADAIPNAILAFLPLLFTGIVFATVVYAEGMKVEIPLAFGRARGWGGRYPIKFLYVSNIPVILASALMLNIRLWARMLQGISITLGGVNVVETIALLDPNGNVIGGVLYLISRGFINPLFVSGGYRFYFDWLLTHQSQLVLPFIGTIMIPEVIHIVTYVIAYTILCIIFGRFWIETTGMGPKEVAAQLQRSGLQIPGYRRDPRIIEKVLERYIPTITILGSAFVGLLAAFADLTGALGTGTGILLTVGILYRFYEQMVTDRMFELYPDLRKLVS